MEKKLEVKNLQISFRTQGGILKAVRNISFDLHKGETFAIVGESGSGKSVTSKAIMGILSGNSIVEGGEIVYDGQDLLKISEEDYHKIRGDKIAMIFQDPMSSLNPIMRIGQQLTEAMILKAKTSKKNARNSFNNVLELLGKNINAVQPANANDTNAKIKTFDNFCIEGTKLESAYNDAVAAANELQMQIENFIFLISKNQKVDVSSKLKSMAKNYEKSLHPFVVVKNSSAEVYAEKLNSFIKNSKFEKIENIIALLQNILELVKEALSKEKPNFFTLGYYVMLNPNADIYKMDIADLNTMTRSYLDNNFMIGFIELAKVGVDYSHKSSIEAKKNVLPKLEEAIRYFEQDEIDNKIASEYANNLGKQVSDAIDRLKVKKNSTQYVFQSAIKNAINEYFMGVKKNPIEEEKYLKNKAKYDNLIAKGKTPDWTLKPQVYVDLELKLGNIRKLLLGLKASLLTDIENKAEFNSQIEVIEVIDYLKEQASKVVVKMNKRIAKAKAIKLMEEVGIPEPAIRFRQYPFQFSGGMRQRIVIAIALSADPDILICDEPTTALDVTIQSQILELINKIKEERKLSVIFITHNLGVVANMADRIAVMYAGKIVEYGKSEEIFYEPAHPYTWALLSSMPDLHTKERLEAIPGTPPNMIYPPKGDAFAARNKYALDIDFELQPPLFEITETHAAATWLLHPNAPKVEMPKIIKDRVERLMKEAQ